WNNVCGTVTLHRVGHYAVEYRLDPMISVAGKTRVMPDAFITPQGTDVTDAFKFYLTPLLGSGMPDAFRLRAPRVPRILPGS
ncbi:MAG: 6-phosphofructokinase, partial [Magnetococcales bacterium]|nr:6-phosphofructokinase [Magnetococcales bacterium]